jgi:hypothetical protein
LTKLQKEMEPRDQLAFFVGIPSLIYVVETDKGLDKSLVGVSVTAGTVPIPCQSREGVSPASGRQAAWTRSWTEPGASRVGVCLASDPQAALAALNKAGHVTVEVTHRLEKPVVFAAWQRRGLPGRRLVTAPAAGADAEEWERLPAFEIRLVRPDGSIKVAGF